MWDFTSFEGQAKDLHPSELRSHYDLLFHFSIGLGNGDCESEGFCLLVSRKLSTVEYRDQIMIEK